MNELKKVNYQTVSLRSFSGKTCSCEISGIVYDRLLCVIAVLQTLCKMKTYMGMNVHKVFTNKNFETKLQIL